MKRSLAAVVLVVSTAAFAQQHADSAKQAGVARFIVPDSESYIVPAENLLAGRGFTGPGTIVSFATSIPGYPNNPGPEAVRTPGYPLLLAAFLAGGAGLDGVIVFQRFLTAAVAVAIFLFARARIGSNVIAILAAVLYISFPVTTMAAEEIMSDAFFGAFVLAFIILLHAALRRRSLLVTGAAGLVLSAAVLIRPVAAYYFVPVLLVLILQTKRRVAFALTFLISSQLLPVAWAVRNRHATGVLTISTTATEILLFQWAAAVQLTSNSSLFDRITALQQPDFRFRLERGQLPLFYRAMEIARREGVDPVPLNQAHKCVYERRLAMQLLSQRPLAIPELMASAVAQLLLFAPAADLVGYGFPAPLALPLLAGSLILAAAGIRSLYLRDPALGLIAAATIVYFTVISASPLTNIRFTLPFASMYALSVAAGIGTALNRRAAGSG